MTTTKKVKAIAMTVPRPEHKPLGEPCILCGLAGARHRSRSRVRADYQKDYRKKNHLQLRNYQNAWEKTSRKTRDPQEKQYIGIDGEGWTDSEGNHHYSYLAACTEDHLIGDIYEPMGLHTAQILEFLSSLPQESWNLKVGFSLGYDITKWIEHLPDSTIWLLNHPEYRKGKWGPKNIRWGEYALNRMSSKFTIVRYEETDHYRCVVWDLFKFFQTTFVKALKQWEVGDQEIWDRIQAMKEKRGDFQGIGEEEKLYCQEECRLLARLARKLVTSHFQAGIKLTSYYGPGSTASAMLKVMHAKEEKAVVPKPMEYAVECAFFGGRFECSQIGPLKGVYSYDIASAYPYAMTQLPCLKHGIWELVQNPRIEEIEIAPAACVHYRLPYTDKIRRYDLVDIDVIRHSCDIPGRAYTCDTAWGPFPFRLKDGNIIFPVTCEGGWVWQYEYLEAVKHWPNVECTEAWILKQNCSCNRPFAYQIAEYYNRRLEWGKDGKGITMKLGVNSCYGKRAQRVGSSPFRCVVSAGMITSRTRSMLLQGITSAKNQWNIVSVATDGIQSLEPLELPNPVFTGTESAAELASLKEGKKKYPLGAWESKGQDDVHMIRPGMRFSLTRESKIDTTAARGLGVKVLHENRAWVRANWDIKPMSDCDVQQPMMFMGSKPCIRPNTKTRELLRDVAAGKVALGDIAAMVHFDRDSKYGKWLKPEPRKVSYSPLPKRPKAARDNSTFICYTWSLDRDSGESVPYGLAPISDLTRELRKLREQEEEQADYGIHILDHRDE